MVGLHRPRHPPRLPDPDGQGLALAAHRLRLRRRRGPALGALALRCPRGSDRCPRQTRRRRLGGALSDDEAFAGALAGAIEAQRRAGIGYPRCLPARETCGPGRRAPAGVVVARSPDPDEASAASADLALLASALAERSPSALAVSSISSVQSAGWRRGARAATGSVLKGGPVAGPWRRPGYARRSSTLDPARPLWARPPPSPPNLLIRPARLRSPCAAASVSVARPGAPRRFGPAKAAEPAAWCVLSRPRPDHTTSSCGRSKVRRSPGKGEVEIETLAWAWNFKDVAQRPGSLPGRSGAARGRKRRTDRGVGR